MNQPHRLIHGHFRNVIMSGKLSPCDMVFADPPDNIGLSYDGHDDAMEEDDYYDFLHDMVYYSLDMAPVCWFSVNAKHIGKMAKILDTMIMLKANEHVWRMFVWYFTFGQHNHNDCGNNFRPIFRIAPDDFEWTTEPIRIESVRQKMGDKRADARGRVPGDVWGGPYDEVGLCRIQGNNKERRVWHPTQHPEGIVKRSILMSTEEGGTVLDPFLGTGTTIRVCDEIGRSCVGIDISREYCDKIAEETGLTVEQVRK